ncbi:MAG: hypothetical protein DRN95_07210 [Candidatus Hydrothermarchaeota archaeon]|nr:MAG: hypothetical protein DRN95_07210 [Candidatus Hydrothermarchaeota archaeon]
MGYRGRRGIYPGNGPFRDLPPWQRPGWVYGYGRGYGGWYWYRGDPTRCARFPWLPRWWWANPNYQGTVPVPPASDPATAPPVPAIDERKFLQEQSKYLEEELAAIKKRLEELKSASKE